MNECIKCLMDVEHPWHDNGTPNMEDMQPIMDEYTNYSGSAGSKE